MAVRGVENDEIAFGVDQCFGAFKALVAHGRRRSHAQTPRCVLGRIRIVDGLFDVLDGNQADAAIGIVHYQQLFDAALVQQAACFVLAHAGLHGRQILTGHQFSHGLTGVFGEAHIAVGKHAHQLAAIFNDRDARNPVPFH